MAKFEAFSTEGGVVEVPSISIPYPAKRCLRGSRSLGLIQLYEGNGLGPSIHFEQQSPDDRPKFHISRIRASVLGNIRLQIYPGGVSSLSVSEQ
jgi:hypothetical protein